MSVKKAFTLIELLIVILIISLSYGIIYNVSLKEPIQQIRDDKEQLIASLKSHPSYKKQKVWLFCNEDNECFTGTMRGNRLQEYEEFSIDTPYLTYRFDKYGDLIPFEFFNIRADRFLFKPFIILYANEDGIIGNNFLVLNDEWWYYSPYEDKYTKHQSMQDVITYAKKSDYFNYRAGDVNDN